jgi:hypothetical protein
MANAYLERQSLSRIGEAGRKAERKTAKRLNMRQTPASGAAIAKGDMQTREFLVEAKSTTRASVVLQHDWLAKIADEAAVTGRTPALSLSFVAQSGKPHRHGAWVAIREVDFLEYLKLIANRE